VYNVNEFCLALDYVEGFDERVVSVGELGLIYAILPEVLLDMMAGNDLDLEME
jgi:hypothetical protein